MGASVSYFPILSNLRRGGCLVQAEPTVPSPVWACLPAGSGVHACTWPCVSVQGASLHRVVGCGGGVWLCLSAEEPLKEQSGG